TVADSIPRRRSDDRELAERRNGKLSDPLHRLEKERPLRLSRRRRLEVTPVAPRARFPGSADPVARRDEDLDGATPPEGAPLFLDFRLDFLTRQRAGHEADAMLPTRDSLAGGSEPGKTHATAGRERRARRRAEEMRASLTIVVTKKALSRHLPALSLTRGVSDAEARALR